MQRAVRAGFLGVQLLAVPHAAIATGDSLQGCLAIADDTARLACYDRLAAATPAEAPAADAAVPASVAVAPVGPSVAAPVAAAAPTPEELFGRDAVASDEIVRRAAGIGQLQEIRRQVTTLRRSAEDKLILSLDNGQVWAQLDTLTIRLSTGDEVRIHRAAMGSYLLDGPGGARAIRVRRVQ